jgi:hypothetical protein
MFIYILIKIINKLLFIKILFKYYNWLLAYINKLPSFIYFIYLLFLFSNNYSSKLIIDSNINLI